jgi:hypothetical protein
MTFQFTLNDSPSDCFDGKGTEIGVFGSLASHSGAGLAGLAELGHGREPTRAGYGHSRTLVFDSDRGALYCKGPLILVSWTIATTYLRPPPVL